MGWALTNAFVVLRPSAFAMRCFFASFFFLILSSSSSGFLVKRDQLEFNSSRYDTCVEHQDVCSQANTTITSECSNSSELLDLVANNNSTDNSTLVDIGYGLLDCLCDLSNDEFWINVYGCYRCETNNSIGQVEAFKSIYCDAVDDYETRTGTASGVSTASTSGSTSRNTESNTDRDSTDSSEGIGNKINININNSLIMMILCNLLL
ncbi:uncharacterized protein ASCRUDRAFT_110809 [Ascoidea rubescens DSM 1968]|uniref:Uncharacterized protein n=1 Tax=Ascoidea rubescens DSM 1968 TaxID=1344418 RepID=A0A1D2VDX4_9ASCO|nr:hypothetical protein ASCRUDRAFT_110809 [Ascoidea rubescens DSM 1968]ODV59693.1 hypothetical protein ASCRUDRAFT_110809 [Ascoidea rubescens DSM 1968]